MGPRSHIRAARGTLAVTAVAAAAAIAGCGGSSTGSSTSPAASQPQGSQSSPAPRAPLPTASIEAAIPTVPPPHHRILVRNTCDGANASLPVQWSNVPAGTAELVMFLVRLNASSTFFDWAVAGLGPKSHGVPEGRLPAGAIVGRNSFGQVGYSICPPKGVYEHYVLRLEALPRRLAVKSGFDAETVYREAEKISKFVGFAGGAYMRR